MKKMYSEEQIAKIASNELDPSQFYGKFVRVIDASTIDKDALTDEQISWIEGGVFINGDFLGIKNPILCAPSANTSQGFNFGLLIGGEDGGSVARMSVYRLHKTFKKIGLLSYGGPRITFAENTIRIQTNDNAAYSAWIEINQQGGLSFFSQNTIKWNDKLVPSYPADQTDKTYALKLVNGTLTWVEETA